MARVGEVDHFKVLREQLNSEVEKRHRLCAQFVVKARLAGFVEEVDSFLAGQGDPSVLPADVAEELRKMEMQTKTVKALTKGFIEAKRAYRTVER